MPIKGLFNQKEKNDDLHRLKQKIVELEQQIKKMNTLEVHVKRFLKMEPQLQKRIFPSVSKKEMEVKTPSPPSHNRNYFIEQEELQKVENKILSKIAKNISLELAPIKQKIEHLEKRITSIERGYSYIKEVTKNNLENINNIERKLIRIDDIEKELLKINDIENELLKINDIEIKLVEVDDIEKRITENISQAKNESPPIVIQEVNVDKIMLDKYEQNNNFGQLGIKDISGQLNIGATYGRGAIPLEFVDDLKEDLNAFKNSQSTVEKESSESNETPPQDLEIDQTNEDTDFEEITIDDS
ncbi:hypothetical protein ACQKP0_00145 [Heyndrickxia sp. NPDC080065]|uniref:hypothetical protein n=1 Tax=Heyndrickxia sp. NPDC080065 TaxID=3390568 RepID=UPI003D033CCC